MINNSRSLIYYDACLCRPPRKPPLKGEPIVTEVLGLCCTSRNEPDNHVNTDKSEKKEKTKHVDSLPKGGLARKKRTKNDE